MMLLVFVVTLLIYLRNLNGEFIADDAAIRDAEELSAKYSRGHYTPLFRRWKTIYHRSPRHLTLMTHQWTWQLFGFRLWAWHAGNILIHLSTCVVLYIFFSQLHVPFKTLAVAAFAVHPLQVPAVAWLSGRAAMLAALFGYLSWVTLLTPYWPLALVPGFLAFFSKEDGFLYIVIWPLILWGFR